MDAIKTISEVARTLLESDAKYDQDICKMTILFPLLETLGYDATKAGDIILNPAYMNNGEYKIDYGLRGIEEDSIKTMVKMIELDAEPGLEFSNIRKCIMPTDRVEYIIITDCFNYFIYANADEGMTFLDVVSFNITKISNEQKRAFGLLVNPNTAGRQDYALRDDEPEEESAPSNNKSITKYVKPTPPPKKTKKADSSVFSMGWMILLIVVCIVIVATGTLLGLSKQNNIDNWYKVAFSFDNVKLNYYTLKGNLKVSTYDDKLGYIKIEITKTNLPANTNITLNLKNDVGLSSKINVLTDASGCVYQDIPVQDSWKNTNITVTANVLFDNYQTADAKKVFGDFGQYIIGLTGSKSVLAEYSVYYDYDHIYETIKNQEAAKAEAELKAIREYFSQFTVVQYSNGDMAFYPKGYDYNDWDTANENITSTNKSYAKIYYNSTTKTGTFYYCIGTFINYGAWPAGVYILSDSINTYQLPVGNSIYSMHYNKYSSITVWSRFDRNGIDGLIPILQQIYSSNMATIEFKDLHKVTISQDDKNAVLSIIDLYTKYFSNGSTILKPEWFQK
jgi:hypothetical protein